MHWDLIELLFLRQAGVEDDEPEDEEGDVDDGSESDADELDTDMIDERDSVDDVRLVYCLVNEYCVCYQSNAVQR